MAMSCRCSALKGGRPTGRIEVSCRSDSGGMSEKSIFRFLVALFFFSVRLSRTDDSDSFFMAMVPECVGDDKNVAGCRLCQPKSSRFRGRLVDVFDVNAVQVKEGRTTTISSVSKREARAAVAARHETGPVDIASRRAIRKDSRPFLFLRNSEGHVHRTSRRIRTYTRFRLSSLRAPPPGYERFTSVPRTDI